MSQREEKDREGKKTASLEARPSWAKMGGRALRAGGPAKGKGGKKRGTFQKARRPVGLSDAYEHSEHSGAGGQALQTALPSPSASRETPSASRRRPLAAV